MPLITTKSLFQKFNFCIGGSPYFIHKKSHQPSGRRWFRGLYFPTPPSLPFPRRNLPLPIVPPLDPTWGAKVSHPVLFPLPSDFCCHSFFDTFLVPPFFRHLALLEPTCSIFVPNLAAKTRSKSIVFGVQDTTYVARS